MEQDKHNAMWCRYELLSDEESAALKKIKDEKRAAMKKIKDDGLAFHDYLNSLGQSREIALAKTKIEEAVMWAVKHITA